MTKLNWIIQPNFIFGYDIQFIEPSLINQILLFDLDSTLIKTKSGKTFPIDSDDWIWLYNDIPSQLQLSNTITGIISNQKGLKNDIKVKEWIKKVNNIVQEIKINFVFASITNDRYRKPMCGSWEYICKQLLSHIDTANLLNKKKIYYIGDAFGRETDFSDTDIKFALNCKFKFKLPEKFFGKSKEKISGTVKYPCIEYYTDDEQNILLEKIQKLILPDKKILIMFVGLPASGKSFVRNILLNKYPDMRYTNNDDINNRIVHHQLVKDPLNCNLIIDDNTNLSFDKRNLYLNKFSSYYKICIHYDHDIEINFHLNHLRMYWFNCPLISTITYNVLKKHYNKETVSDGFDSVVKINKVFYQMNFDEKIKYYF